MQSGGEVVLRWILGLVFNACPGGLHVVERALRWVLPSVEVDSTLWSWVRIFGRRLGPSCLAGDREGVVARVATELGEE